MDAARTGDTAEVRRLVAAGADMRVGCCARPAVWSPTALRTVAALTVWVRVMPTAELCRQECGGTALLLAAGLGHTGTVTELVRLGAKEDAKDDVRITHTAEAFIDCTIRRAVCVSGS
jgi:hypothetical protein